MSIADIPQEADEDIEEQTPDAIFLERLDGWDQVLSIGSSPGGIFHRHTMLGEPPKLAPRETELVRVVTNCCGSNAAILVGQDGEENRFIGKWNGTILDDHPNQEDLYERAFDSWIETLKALLLHRS